MDNAVDVRIFANRWAVVVPVVDDVVMAVNCGDEPAPIGLLETGERPQVIKLKVLVVRIIAAGDLFPVTCVSV